MHTYENQLNVEENILYVLLTNPEKQAFIARNLNKIFFEDSINRKIFECALQLHFNGEDIDPITIADKLKNPTATERISDILSCSLAISAMCTKYCKILFGNYLDKLIKSAKSEADFDKINELKNHYLFEEQRIVPISYKTEDFDKRYKDKEKTTVFTYFPALDECIGSFMGGDYIALGASTGVGKTAFALNLARQVCIQDKSVLYFSLEMPLEQLQNRFVCMNQSLSALKFRSFGFNLIEMQKYKKGLQELKQWDLHIVTDYDLTPEKMRNYISQKKKDKLDFVILDYLGLVSGYTNKSLYEKTSLVSRKIKLMAGEFNIPVLVLVQLNRDLKNRQDKRPLLSDIRESGAIEQDADFVLFAHRQGIYDKNIPENDLEIIIAKNRHGTSQRIIHLKFDLVTQNITE